MSENLKLWNKVEKTNPKYTKKAKIGGMAITAIAPQYQIMQVTEQFGTYGETWGFKKIELDYSLIEKYDMIVFKGTFFFPKGEFEIINSSKLFMNNAKTMLDDNFAKKIETDALTKAISKLGFNADIFMGKFDDVRYLQEVTAEFSKLSESEISEISKKIKNAKELSELSVIFKSDERISTNLVLKSLLSAKRKEIEVPKEQTERFLEFIKGIDNQKDLDQAKSQSEASKEPYKAMIKLQEIKLNKK